MTQASHNEEPLKGEPSKSDLSRAFSEDGPLKTHVGGQALIEGIMMRGKYNWSVAVREPDGTIYIEEHELSGGTKEGWRRWPFVRGCKAFVDSLILGFKALSIAAEHAFVDDGEMGVELEVEAMEPHEPLPEIHEQAQAIETLMVDREEAPCAPPEASTASGEHPRTDHPEKERPSAQRSEARSEAGSEDTQSLMGTKEMVVSMVLGLVLGVALFIVVPAALTNLIVGEYDDRTLLWNIVDGLLRIAIFIFYIWLIGRMQDIKRMFGYHGAEHKAIHCYEHGLPMTPENARSFPRLHVRCGTAFLIMVMILAIFIYTVVPLDPLIAALGLPDGPLKLCFVIAIRIVLMPLIAGIAYEITVKWAGNHPDNPLVKAVLWPGMQMQYLTTREPDDEQIECAIRAMERVLEREEREEQRAQRISHEQA